MEELQRADYRRGIWTKGEEKKQKERKRKMGLLFFLKLVTVDELTTRSDSTANPISLAMFPLVGLIKGIYKGSPLLVSFNAKSKWNVHPSQHAQTGPLSWKWSCKLIPLKIPVTLEKNIRGLHTSREGEGGADKACRLFIDDHSEGSVPVKKLSRKALNKRELSPEPQVD